MVVDGIPIMRQEAILPASIFITKDNHQISDVVSDVTSMTIVIRVDSSVSLGSGHLTRCRTLAHELSRRGADIEFICRTLPGDGTSLIESDGFRVLRISEGARAVSENADQEADLHSCQHWLSRRPSIDWLVVDHYRLGARWESGARAYARNVMAIDDLANRRHDVDLLLDQNLCEDFEVRYDELVPARCRKLLGPTYVLLRPEFQNERRQLRPRTGTVRRILVSFGGSDPTDETAKAITAIQAVGIVDLEVDIVIGAAYAHRTTLAARCAALPRVRLHHQVSNMAELMQRADLAIGASGSTVWERLALGLPSLVVTTAENQEAIARYLGQRRYIHYLGKSDQVDSDCISTAIKQFVARPNLLTSDLDLVDALGVARVAAALFEAIPV